MHSAVQQAEAGAPCVCPPAAGYQPSVTDYQGLLSLAKEQGSLGAGTRGACKLCGGMGHLTKQCTNFLTGHTAAASADVVPGAPGSAAAAGPSGAAPALGLLPDPDDISGLSSLSSSESGSSSGSDSGRDRKKSSKKRKRSKEKRSKDRKEKSRKEKKRKVCARWATAAAFLGLPRVAQRLQRLAAVCRASLGSVVIALV